MKPFQIIVTTIFIIVAVAGVLVFALAGQNNQNIVPRAMVWGSVSNIDIQQIVSSINADKPTLEVAYEYHDPKKIDDDFVNALAEGRGPDIIIFPDNKFLSYKSKLFPIPYANFPERTYLDSFVDGTNIFLGKDGVWAVPFSIDPLVMYWNKTLFTDAGLAVPPRKWSDLTALTEKLVKKNSVGGVSQALVSMGEYRNINNAKDIIATLMFQAHNPISAAGLDRDQVEYVVDDQTKDVGNTIPAVEYYTSFSNPTSPMYTWNRSFPNSSLAFTAGDVALYFGMASEIGSIRNNNPNLYFDVAPMLQSGDSGKSSIKATIYAMAVVKNSKNLAGAFAVLNYMTNLDSQKYWAILSGLPPARRDLLSLPPDDPFQTIFYKSAIQSQTWLDPDPDLSSQAFQEMIESVTTGRQRANEVVSPLSDRLRNIYLAQ